jgi:dephospho-CoA kinase
MTSLTPPSSTLPFSIGLTGGIGCGKTTVANQFAQLGAAIIDTDLIAHSLTVPNGIAMPAILASFGPEYVTPEGAMNRQAMRQLVFKEARHRKTLEAILHPLIRQETERAAANHTGCYPIFVVPLLLESPQWRNKTTRILVIDCSEEVQIARVMQRSQLNRDEVLAIMAAQTSRQTRLAHADDIINNDGDTQALMPQIAALHALYLDLSAKK